MRENIYWEAIAKFGIDSQLNVAVEEMSELTKEICKNNRGFKNVNHIAEEIADVEIMLEQLKLIFDCEEAVEDWKDKKIARLALKIFK